MVSLLLVFLALSSCCLVTFTRAHIWAQCPHPRNCFFENPVGSSDGDGEWRRAPCPFEPGARGGPTPIVAGKPFCLRVHEFVDHPGYWDVSLATQPVAPRDPQSLFTVPLVTHREDTANGTAYHNIEVVLPTNITCTDRSGLAKNFAGGNSSSSASPLPPLRSHSDDEFCTIQIRQWAEDFQWYYYACVDVRVVSEANVATSRFHLPSTTNNCTRRIMDGTCSAQPWEPADSLLRVTIRQSIYLGVVGLVSLVALIVVVIAVIVLHFKCSGTEIADSSSTREEEEEVHQDDDQNATNRGGEEAADSARAEDAAGSQSLSTTVVDDDDEPAPSLLSRLPVKLGIGVGVVLLFSFAGFLGVGIHLLRLKQCDYDTSGERSV